MTILYFSGELKERNLVLWFVPRPLLKCLGYMFGERHFSSTDTSCSRCTAIFSVFLVPLAAAIGLIVLTFFLALMLLFLPVFIVFILPCAIVYQCKQIRKAKVIKIQDIEETGSLHESEELHPLRTDKTETLTTTLGDEQTPHQTNKQPADHHCHHHHH